MLAGQCEAVSYVLARTSGYLSDALVAFSRLRSQRLAAQLPIGAERPEAAGAPAPDRAPQPSADSPDSTVRSRAALSLKICARFDIVVL